MTFWLSARLFESPELYWSFDELCWNEAPLRRPFLKILYENTDKNKNKPDAEITKTYKLSNKIICKPPQSRETIPLTNNIKIRFVNCSSLRISNTTIAISLLNNGRLFWWKWPYTSKMQSFTILYTVLYSVQYNETGSRSESDTPKHSPQHNTQDTEESIDVLRASGLS